jgi:hypothetical protein
LVTNQVLSARLDALRSDLTSEMATMRSELLTVMERGFRAQTWRLMTAIFVAMGLAVTLSRV